MIRQKNMAYIRTGEPRVAGALEAMIALYYALQAPEKGNKNA